MIDKIGLSLLTMFGIGYFKYAPGTAASFITCLIYYILWLSDFSLHSNKIYLVFFLIIILFYSIIIIDKLSHLFKKKDPREIVVDEFVGQSIPLMSFIFSADTFVPIGEKTDNLIIFILLSFVLFRLFDIVKPFPINIVDKKMKNGVGVMLDDIIAGIYSTIVIYIIYALWF
jgi:phosphatidylglycerophosphatase A